MKISIEIMVLNKIWTRIHWFLTEYHWKITKLHVLIDLDRPNRSKTIKNRKIHPGELSEFFSFFFVKNHFSHFFQLFSSAPWRDFRDFARSVMQSTIVEIHGSRTVPFNKKFRNSQNGLFFRVFMFAWRFADFCKIRSSNLRWFDFKKSLSKTNFVSRT